MSARKKNGQTGGLDARAGGCRGMKSGEGSLPAGVEE